MEKYTFLAVAPCTFIINNERYDLTAGQTLTVDKAVANKLTSSSFQYKNFLNLVYKTEPKSEPEPEPELEKVAETKKGKAVSQTSTESTVETESTPRTPSTTTSKKTGKTSSN